MYRETITVYEQRHGWARITEPYKAGCSNGQVAWVDEGNSDCSPANGVEGGEFSAWVSLEFLSADRPPDPAETALPDEQLMAKSDDFLQHREIFAAKAEELIASGRCSTSDFQEFGGWTRSFTKGENTYFIFCGGIHVDDRIYLDADTGGGNRSGSDCAMTS